MAVFPKINFSEHEEDEWRRVGLVFREAANGSSVEEYRQSSGSSISKLLAVCCSSVFWTRLSIFQRRTQVSTIKAMTPTRTNPIAAKVPPTATLLFQNLNMTTLEQGNCSVSVKPYPNSDGLAEAGGDGIFWSVEGDDSSGDVRVVTIDDDKTDTVETFGGNPETVLEDGRTGTAKVALFKSNITFRILY